MANSKKRCKQCREYYPANEMIKLPAGTFCTIEHATEFAQDKAKKDREKQRENKHKELKKKVKREDIGHQKDLTQRVFNKLRVLQELKWFKERGIEPECISCGKQNMDWCCGHFKTRGSQSNLRYDPKNTYLQCNRYCNSALSGNIEGTKTTRGYKQGLIERFGEEKASEIFEYCKTNTAPRKFSSDELIEMRKDFNRQIKELENEKTVL